MARSEGAKSGRSVRARVEVRVALAVCDEASVPEADRFKYARELGWHKSKSVAPERAIGLSDAEKARCALNLARAREIRNMRSAQGGATA